MQVLVLGALNIDHVYAVPHLVREGETLASFTYRKNEGGKGLNQAVALAKAGADVHFAGAIGPEGAFLLDFLAQFGVNTAHVRTLDVPTGHALIQVDKDGRNAIILYGGANRHITPGMIEQTLSQFGEGDTVLLQNEISGFADILAAARRRKIGIALNPSPITEALLRTPLDGVDWLILNEIEGYGLTGETTPDAILDALLKRHPSCRAVLTLGQKGALYADARRRAFQPAIPAATVDSTAAGDTFTGYFLHTALSGGTVEAALRKAAIAAALSVGRPGAGRSIPFAREVDAFLETGAPPD